MTLHFLLIAYLPYQLITTRIIATTLINQHLQIHTNNISTIRLPPVSKKNHRPVPLWMPPNGQTPYLCIARMVMISWIHGWSKNFPARIMRLDTIFMAFLPCFMDLGMLNPSSFCFKASLLRKCWNTDEADLEKNLDGKLMPLPFKKKGWSVMLINHWSVWMVLFF